MTETPKKQEKIDFGFEDVPVEEKRTRVREVFDSVASRYDIMNDAMSLGVHRLWKSVLMDSLNPQEEMVLVDVAGGTGDISFGFLRRGGGSALVCDINHAMLKAGCDRSEAEEFGSRAQWICGNAESLPLADKIADAYTITFGIRNVTHRDLALRDAYRVLKPGGHFLCLEFSVPDTPGFDKLYDFYSFNVLPQLGSAIAGDADSYRYLAESIRKFPKPEVFAGMIGDAGFGHVSHLPLSGGIASLYSAWRL
jgi:demethylmenaquinone methyltransferase/2-methoxy-6-polyprenyl-1,4-benzoquinol methylase